MGKTKPPLFDDKVLEIIKRGAIAPVKLTPLTYTDAQALRMRIYRHRSKLLALPNHELSLSATLISVKLIPTSTGVFAIHVQPKDMNFEAAYLNAGLLEPKDEPPALD